MAKFAIKIYRYGNYTRAWLNYMCKVYGLIVTEEKDADIILLSLSDPTEINLIFEARRGQKPIILGGCEAFHEKMYSNLVDLINVGEGFEIFEKLQLIKNESPGKIIEKLKDLPYIYYKGKEENIYPSTKVNWDLVPIVKTGVRRKIILGGRGCRKKCKFCYTSWTTKYQNNPWDKNYLIGRLTYASQRFRIWSMKKDFGSAYWRTCLHRARTREEIEEIYCWKKKTGKEILELIEQKGWLHLYNQNNSTNIKFWYEAKK